MTFPLDLIIIIIAAELYREVEPLGRGFLVGAGAQSWLYPWLAYLALSFLVSIILLRLAEAGFSSSGPTKGYRLYKTLRLLHRAVGVVLYPVFLYVTGWNDTISEGWGLPACAVVDDILILMPYLVWTLNWHLLSLRMGRILWHREWPLGEHMWFYFRQEMLPVLGPWLLLRAVVDGVRTLSGIEGFEPFAEWGEVAVYAFFFFVFLYLFPRWLALTLGTASLEEGPLREGIRGLMKRSQVQFRDILVWRTGGARVLNAAVVGLFSGTRYCILSDTLLETLPPDETEAVVAHELGHVTGHHLPVYLAFVFLFMGVSMTLFAAVPADLAENYLFSMPVLAVLTVVFWPGVFGIVSRSMEDEADLSSAELVGDPEPLIRALSRMAASAGSGRASGSWRHRSVDERVGRLRTLAANPKAAALFHKRVRVLRWGAALAALVSIVVSLQISLPEVWSRDTELDRARAAAKGDLENADAWTLYGKVLLKRSMVYDAEKAFLQALEGDPGRRDVREHLRSLPAGRHGTLVRMADVFMRAGWYDDAHRIAEELKAAGEIDASLLVGAKLALTPGSRALPNSYRNTQMAESLLRELLGEEESAGRRAFTSEAYALLAMALIGQEKTGEARAVLDEALGYFPDDAVIIGLLEEMEP